MCTVCGCGAGETRIEGQEHGHEHPHEHSHQHADGSVHSHAHTHEGEHHHHHPEGVAGAAAQGHSHWHQHADGSWHDHPHGEHSGDHRHEHGPAHQHGHDHSHDHSHDHTPATAAAGSLHFGQGPARAHAPGLSQSRMVQIEQDILSKNNGYAYDNRKLLAERGIFSLNLVSSPGSGKTTLLTRSLTALRGKFPLAVIEGDQETAFDAERIRATGVPALQINTGKGCHLDAHMVGHALEEIALPEGGILFIENVGNLVCPAAFDLGESAKVAILSVTEGADKPLKYPDMFHAARLMLINKTDLLPHVDFDVDQAIDYARRVNPKLEVICVSAKTGEGFEAWLAWLEQGLATVKGARIAQLEAELARLKGSAG